jgi:hypothetical protein
VAQLGDHDACANSAPLVSSQGVVASVKEWSFLTNQARVLSKYSPGSCSYFLSRSEEWPVSNPKK